jgi:uncharacterized protein YprB with RNaseH-like and TPR domain/predicted nuclease with RNAse H fold
MKTQSAPIGTLTSAVIEQTFIHLPGIGRKTEHRLWQGGFRSWEKLRDALSNGLRLRDLFDPGRTQQTLLFSAPYGTQSDKRCVAWLDALEESERALREQHFAYFLERLNSSNYWRVLAPFLHAALYLDIETTGLTKDLNYMTVVGALHGNRFYQWVWPEPLDLLTELIRQSPLVVTFNGARFDIPFLRHQAAEIPAPRAHVDLLYLARAAGHAGGQKEVEEQLGLTRPVEVQGLEGKEAVALWCNALCGDRASFRRLLQYNETDVAMLPRLAEKLCNKLAGGLDTGATANCAALPAVESVAHAPSSFAALQRAWEKRRCGLHLLGPKLQAKLGREPVVVGIDLRGNPRNPTGWARCCGDKTETRVLYDDTDILALTKSAKPDLVSIDAPLSLPRGRVSVWDDSPCRKTGGIVRDAERILWGKGIRVYPALIRNMQGLTERGIRLTAELEQVRIPVIESYPGAAQDILGIARKKDDPQHLRRGLSQFGFQIRGEKTHDELDAITSALVAYFYLVGDYEGVGAEDEGFLIVPRWTAAMRWSEPCDL